MALFNKRNKQCQKKKKERKIKLNSKFVNKTIKYSPITGGGMPLVSYALDIANARGCSQEIYRFEMLNKKSNFYFEI